MTAIWRRHGRFLTGLILGAAAAVLARLIWPALSLGDLALIFANVSFAAYLVAALHMTRHLTPELLRRHSEIADEGAGIVAVLAIAVCAASLLAVFVTLGGIEKGEVWRPALALSAIPLGWIALHMQAGFHYAGLWYGPGPASRGLDFPGGDTAPGIWDFLYFGFGIGMTAQTADVQITAPVLRRVVTAHAMLSFFYNTVLLALAVNAAVSLSGG